MLFLIVLVVALCGLITSRLHQKLARRSLDDQARLCAAALVPGPNGDLSESISRLQERFTQLTAVATLDAAGNLRAVYPARPAHRQAVLTVLENGAEQVEIESPQDHGTLIVSGVVVPLNGSADPMAQKVMILLRCDSLIAGWLRGVVIFAFAVAVAGLVSVWSLQRWFDRRVVLPLRRMADAVRHLARRTEESGTLEPGGWYETTDIAERFVELHRTVQARTDAARELMETAARAQRMEHEMERQIRQQEIGFHRQLRRAKDRAKLDPLTSLRNRSFLDEEVESLFSGQQAKGEDLSVVMLDFDNFKQYNDAHGHQAGDAVLRFAGALLHSGVRPTDHAIRYGGDEFLLILPDTSAEQAGAIGERIVKLFGQYAKRLSRTDKLSLSAGVASRAKDRPENSHALIAKADAALYVAKRKGKNTVEGHKAAPALGRRMVVAK